MTEQQNKKVKLPEFIFGNLSTPQGRLEQARLNRVGLFHDCYLIPCIPQANQEVSIKVKVGQDISIKNIRLSYTTDGSIPNSEAEGIPFERTDLIWDTLQWCYLEEWTVKIPPQKINTLVQYFITAITTNNQTLYCPYFDVDSPSFSVEDRKFYEKFIRKNQPNNQPQIYSFYVDEAPIPSWFQEAIIYQIFVDRFSLNPGEEFPENKDLGEVYGGTLKGIIDKLDYLQELGINCLWLTPIFESGSHHGYDATDYSVINPRFGTLEDFQQLINQAHQRGIKIILDYVANHFSNQHPAFLSAQQDKNSPTYPWFYFKNWPEKYEAFYDLPSLPKIDTDNPQARNYLISNAQKWLQLGVDGFRLDHAHGVTHSFWSAFRHATRITQADSITFGEITEPSDVVRSYTGRMDGVLDFELLEIFREFLAFETLKVSEFDKKINQHYAYFGNNLIMPSFLDNHDMNRFLWVVEGDKRRLRLAALCQFTLPNPPIIYYGTEVGLSQQKEVGRLEESRLPMLWGIAQDKSLLKFYQNLIKLRQQGKFSQSSLQTITVDDTNGVYIYKIADYQVILHNHSQQQTIDLPPEITGTIIFKTEPDIDHNSNTKQLTLPPYSGGVLLT